MSSSLLAQSDKPNILWLTSEDNSAYWLGCYGNKNARTPNLDKLASEGFQYMNAFANAPVCASSRSTWITGINSLSMGTHHMRSRYPIPHDKIPYYPDLLRQAGYYCSNTPKTDYNIGGRKDKECWDSTTLNWNELKQKQPFFQVLNFIASHESKVHQKVPNRGHQTANTTLRSYHPDLPQIRQDYAKYHDAITEMDAQIGTALKQLQESGLAENTIVIYNSDHGGVLPRSKRFLFDSGIHCPLIVRIPKKLKHLWPTGKIGTKVDRLVSFVDMPKTWLSLTGAETPDHLQGTTFLGFDTEKEPTYHAAYRGRMDERYDNCRAIRDKQFLYIRNYMPYAPRGQRLHTTWKINMSHVWEKHIKDGLGNTVTSRYFNPKLYTEELYDTNKDPDNTNNLIKSPEFAAIIKKKRQQLKYWQANMCDAGLLPEADLVKRAKANNTTIYELVRKPKLYDLQSYLTYSELAIQKDLVNIATFTEGLKQVDSGIRYWSMVGLFLLDKQALSAMAVIQPLINDESHEVRALAAWYLVKNGHQNTGLECLQAMLLNNSYAKLKILNVIDWMGDSAKTLLPVIQNLELAESEKFASKMKSNILINHGLPASYKDRKKKNNK
ncbi:MAG: sulfatase [Lentisphaeraceae bacterium]|nr:sulfatase [Lentisphaeraceae bacterium]